MIVYAALGGFFLGVASFALFMFAVHPGHDRPPAIAVVLMFLLIIVGFALIALSVP